MILRRVIEHFRKQEWTAIFLDFVIVVAGVFIGIQVANWNAARLDRQDELQLLRRLYNETIVLAERLQTESDRILPMRDTLWSLRPALLGGAPREPLTDYECWTLAASHAVTNPTNDLPTLDEILSTGRLDLIKNPAVKERLRDFVFTRNEARAALAGANNEPFRLANRHPNLLQYAYDPDNEIALPSETAAGLDYRHEVRCRLEELRESAAFLNDYVDNLGRLRATIKYGVIGMQEQLSTLQEALAIELDIPSELTEAEDVE